ncbi:MAG: GNAT family N-acetyltransferase [Acidobacteriota bacterium]|nr:GNAT family N-acetyltransferase [Acidobacteriota bacterium]
MEIIEATVQDIELLVALFDQYREFYGQSTDRDGARRFLRERMERGESKVYLAVADGSSVGFVQLYPSFSSVSMQLLWILNDLFVIPSARRSGVAKALMERARQLAIATGAKGLALSTGVGNASAQRLYEELGYRKDHEFHSYFLTT